MCAPVYGGHCIGSHCLSRTWCSAGQEITWCCLYILYAYTYLQFSCQLSLFVWKPYLEIEPCTMCLQPYGRLHLDTVQLSHVRRRVAPWQQYGTFALDQPLTYAFIKCGWNAAHCYCILLSKCLCTERLAEFLYPVYTVCLLCKRTKQLVWKHFHQHLQYTVYPCYHKKTESYSPLHPRP